MMLGSFRICRQKKRMKKCDSSWQMFYELNLVEGPTYQTEWQKQAHTDTNTSSHTWSLLNLQKESHTKALTITDTNKDTYTQTHTQSHIHTQAHTNTHTLRHTHTDTPTDMKRVTSTLIQKFSCTSTDDHLIYNSFSYLGFHYRQLNS